MRVLVDARMLLGRFSGVPRFVTRLIDELVVQGDIRVVALMGDEPYAPWADRRDIEQLRTDFGRGDRTPLRRWAWESHRLGDWIGRGRVDVFHAAWNSGIPPGCPVPSVLTIHDLIPWNQAARGVSGLMATAAYRRGIRSSAGRASLVTTVSDFVRSEVLKTLRVEPARVHTVYNGADVSAADGAQSSNNRNAPGDFFLYIGGMEPRKNLELLIRAAAIYRKRFGPLTLRLTGDADQLAPQARRALEGIEDRASIHFLGRPTDEELAELYGRAVALVMPSRAEGFGLPVVEAMARGCPVIAARAGSLPEIVANAGLLVDPDDPDALAVTMRRVYEDAALRSTLAGAGNERAASFTWARTAARLREMYGAVLYTPSAETVQKAVALTDPAASVRA